MIELPNFSNAGYKLIKILGQNHHGGRVTYLAEDLKSQRKVAIKQFQFTKSSLSWTIKDSLTREAKILEKLNHPRIPYYINSFDNDLGFCLVQEYKDALSLAEIRTFSPQQVKAIAISVLEILVYLQQQVPPIIHRDIKPANILVDDDCNAYLIDFGFSRIGGEDVSGSSVVKGTPGFMPPEQLWGRLTTASDLYSLGMTLICLLSGIKGIDLYNYINGDRKIEIDALILGVSDRFKQWLSQTVQPNPNSRFDSALIALETLSAIEITSSATERKQPKIELANWLNLRSTALSLTVGILWGSLWGIAHNLISLGIGVGIILGLGLSLIFAYSRKSSNFFNFPAWQSMLGTIITAIAVGLLINPTILVNSARYIEFATWKPNNHRVATGEGFVFYTDVADLKRDRRYLTFLNQFRQEVGEHLFDPGKTSCLVDIHLLKQDKNYFAIANRFGMRTPYGFFMRPVWRNHILVVRENSGLGTLTHQMMYHYLACSYPEGLPLWARQGAATFVEKFLAWENKNNDRLDFSWGYRSNWRDPHVRKILSGVNLADVLQVGKEQSVIRSFFLYLHHRQLLFPLLDRLHGERGNGIDRIEQLLEQPMIVVEKQWKQWLLKEAIDLPKVESSFMVWGQKANRVKAYLDYFWLWNPKKKMWLQSPKRDRDYIIPSAEKILELSNID